MDEYGQKFQQLERSIDAVRSDHRRAMRDLDQSIASVRAEYRDAAGRMADVSAGVRQVGDDVVTLRKQFADFAEEERRTRNMQFAQSALIDIRAQRDRKFGHYAAVRRSAVGMLRAMDTGIVTQNALRQAAERLMIDTPGYWLAPVQVALAAWISDSEELAKRGLRAAMDREPNKTVLFFTLVLARYERYEATENWMKKYVSRQDPKDLSSEFTVVLDAVAQGELGRPALEVVRDSCVSWYETLRDDKAIVTEQSRLWRQGMVRNQREIADPSKFPVLAQICPDWGGVAEWLNAATVYENTEQWLHEQLDEPFIQQDFLSDRMDNLLFKLVTDHDPEEDSLRDWEAKWEKVIEHWGDHAAAAQAAKQPDKPKVNFLTLLTAIGLEPQNVGASVPTRQFAIRLASKWIISAMESLAASNKAPKVEINIEEWHSDLNFGSDGHGEACRNFVDFVDNEVQQEIGKIHNYDPVTALCLTVLAILGGAAGLIFRIFAIIDLASFNAVAAVGLVASFIWLMRRRRGFPDRREEIIKRGENRKTAGLAKIGHAADELREMHRLWTEEVQKKDSLIEFLNAEGNSMPVPPALTGQSTLTVAGEGPQAELPGGVAAGADNQSGDDQPFAFRLPHWDLQPPSSTDGALRG